jgi:hypothetical protein
MKNIKEKAQAERIVLSLLYAQIKSWKLQNGFPRRTMCESLNRKG